MTLPAWTTLTQLQHCLAATDPAADPAEAALQLRWLGRYGQRNLLADRARQLPLLQPPASPQQVLQLAVALRLAGDAVAADALLLEADHLAPQLALIPDLASSTSAPPPGGDPQGLQARSAVAFLQRWRWLDAAALEQLAHTWLEEAAESWWQGLSEEQLDTLALLLHHPPAAPQALLQGLISLVSDEAMHEHPGAALRLWGLLADACPHWDYARLKAAELALERGDLELCAHWLAQPDEPFAANPWASDLAARLALAEDRASDALAHWSRALALASDQNQAELVEIFRQRRREARRGPGLLLARSLLQAGDPAALPLLEDLVAQDPQWQPLRSLLEQARGRQPEAQAAPATSSGEGAEHFAAFLEQAARRCGLPLAAATAPADPEPPETRLEAFAAALTQAEARLALAP